MTKQISLHLSLILLLCVALPVLADGPQHNEENRYTGGPVLILSLTKAQIRFLDTRNTNQDADERLLCLTSSQTEIIRKKWGVGPTKLEIWETQKGEWDCSCMAANLGFRFTRDKIEIPKEYVVSDEEAMRIRNPDEEDCNKDVETFDACNNPSVMNYLEKLSKNDIGKTLKGVRLTDGTIELKGYTFLGEAKDVGKGVHLYIFRFKKNRLAYIWIDEDGTELSLPSCPKAVSFESTYGLTGDVYTYAALQPAHGVVHTMCVKKEWMTKLK